MAVITISRQLGSGGEQVAKLLCQMLHYAYFDRDLMRQVAGESDLPVAEPIDYTEYDYRVQNVLERILQVRRLVGHTLVQWPSGRSEIREFYEHESIELVRFLIRAAYRRGNVVIVGRGGQAILRDMPGVLHVRIVAPLVERVRRTHHTLNITRAAAVTLVNERDRAAAEYLKRFHGIAWDDPTLYHLVLNTGKWSAMRAAQLIADAVHRL
ncbi:MAG: cytidylate kinase-like family protein [Anaerolineae bacterium]